MTSATKTAIEKPLTFTADEAFARHLDSVDPLRASRDEFHIPKRSNGQPMIYFAGNSLGLQPKGTRRIVDQELDDWAKLAVDAHFEGKTPWYSYHEIFRQSGARLVGALPGAGADEVVMMNSLTVNLHLMMVTFYQPTKDRFKILIEEPCFPSDIYAVTSHVRTRGLDPRRAIIVAKPRKGEHTLRMDDLEELIEREGKSLALIMLSGVNFFTGQVMDIARMTAAGRRQGCVVGWDLAHAAGNVPTRLHDWNVDFAVWCSYKYLNSGPGAVAGCFVHQRHGQNSQLPRFAGWWGNDPETRFKMQLIPEFVPRHGADGWQISNPPILSMAPLKASLDLFDRAGMDALRKKSLLLTSYLRFLLGEQAAPGSWQIITPERPEEHGCQLSILINDHPRERFKALLSAGVVGDFREPNVIRIAPTPMYNTFHEAWTFANILGRQK
ncbi:MAG: kynureninase [Phycisphaerales bacterium]|nr:kynureninase [Phycisphaerales bacterium]MCI0631431.1 kynureninase [Phycisphaerales bacterium]MCI0676586.1 kynureninase [Phycisphaerales bacterium]